MLPSFHHDLPTVEDYLHHRAPYLMVGEIREIRSDRISAATHISGDETYLAGHFPGAAVVPGAMMQEMTTQAAGILIAARHNPMAEFNTHDPFFNKYALGVLIRVKASRFRGFARSGDTLQIRVELLERVGDLFDFRGEVAADGRKVMSNTFQLANILSETLQGSPSESAAAD